MFLPRNLVYYKEPILPHYQDIEAAYARIKHMVIKTPLLTSDRLNDILGYRLFIKAEPLQRTGAFKFRGACNAILSLADTERSVIAFSSGNHAQAIALVARLTARHATIIMPQDAPQAKIDATRGYGAEVILYDRYKESREEIGETLATKKQAILIKPYDDEAVIAGQGTIGIELTEQCNAQDIRPDHLICCAGGGGLISGLSIAFHQHFEDTKIYSAEPADFDDIAKSLQAGKKIINDPDARSICDAIVTPTPGDITFPIMQTHLTAGFAASDDDVLRAMQTAWRYFKLVVEPGGAVALAAGLSLADSLQQDVTGQDVVVVASGGNADEALFTKALAMPDAI